MMNEYWQYLFEASICFAVTLPGLYLISLKNGLHRFNRFLSIFLLVFSLLCPLIEFQIPWQTEGEFYELELEVYEGIVSVVPFKQYPQERSYKSPTNFWVYIYFTGCLIFLANFLRQWILIFQIKKYAKRAENKFSNIYYSGIIKAPFSFVKWIFLPAELDRHSDADPIILHEMAHLRQRHSIDLLFIELLRIFFWFHPLLWIWKRTHKIIHEYLADQEVIHSGYSIQEYLFLLRNYSTRYFSAPIFHSFSSPIIIHRFRMLTKTKSPKFVKLPYLLFIPVLALLLQAFTLVPLTPQSPLQNFLDPSLAGSEMPTEVGTIEVIDNSIPSISPIKAEDLTKISSHFGMRYSPFKKKKEHHRGVDMVAPIGTPVYATGDGQVVVAKLYPNYGNKIVIDHGSGFSSLYAHLNGFNVKAGQQVKQGDVIGYVGNTGKSMGPHLHYEVRKDNIPVNPMSYISQ
ncbi:MAG: M23/M56 family metallopeptidase [Bacteroidia bacterium]|nr:M23/M56 family metallopeptidase [Bacteroidia bacterium]